MKYEGIPLTPRVFEEILIELYDGKQFTRQDAIDCVVDYYASNGGKIENKNYVSVFKKASQNLRDSGLENKGYGIWALTYNEKDLIEVIEASKPKSANYSVDEIIGEGKQSVYVYYFDIYRKYAELSGNKVFPCKIGRTDVNPLERVVGQAGTAYPEMPHIALIVKCDDSTKLETAIHSILKFKGKWIESAPGSEWFITSPEEIRKIYDSIKE